MLSAFPDHGRQALCELIERCDVDILLAQQIQVASLLAGHLLSLTQEQAGHMAGRGCRLLAMSMRRNHWLSVPCSAPERGEEAGHVRFAIRNPLCANLAPQPSPVMTAFLPPAEQILLVGIMDALGLDRVRLIGHDWGGWVGFLLCLRQPDRIARFLALGILHPWQQLDLTLLRNLWRFGYQGIIASPLLGAWLVRHPGLIGRLMRWDSADREQWREQDLRWYTELLQDPARARASVLLYRTFLLREALPVLRGRYRDARLQVPTLVLVGARDLTVPPSLLHGYEPYADAMAVEVVPEAGHFLPEECPALVADRANVFFGRG